jgi:hypothetical protein
MYTYSLLRTSHAEWRGAENPDRSGGDSETQRTLGHGRVVRHERCGRNTLGYCKVRKSSYSVRDRSDTLTDA